MFDDIGKKEDKDMLLLFSGLKQLAEANMVYYRALIAKGFTKEEALKLVQAMTSATIGGAQR